MKLPVPDSNRVVVEKKPGEKVAPADLLVSVKGSDTYTADRAREILLTKEVYDEAQDWLTRHWEDQDTPSGVNLTEGFPFASQGQLRDNLDRLAGAIETFLSSIGYGSVEFSSGFRPPAHNAAVGGVSTSRHMSCLAVDLSVFDDTGREIGPSEVAEKARDSPAPFEKALIYNSFVHLAIPRREGAFGGTEIQNVGGPTGGPTSPVGEGDYFESAGAFENEIFEGNERDQTSAGDFKGSPSQVVLEQLGVRQATNHEDLDANYEENKDLVGKPPPVEGEMDLGDLRFGSVMFDEKDPSDLNQVSAINQQNAGSVGMAQMLRTDMNPVLSDNTVLPEMVVTLTVNATDRDDVNRRLRPLVAMHRRMPFNLARNADLARMMLGLGLTANTADRLERLYPEMAEERRRAIADSLDEASPSNIWIPVTIRDVSVQSQPGSGNLYQVSVVLRYANTSPYVPQLKLWGDSKSAVEWAQYVSDRSRRGSLIQHVNGSNAQIVTRDEEQRNVTLPVLTGQVSSPYKSFPMKKFYRGLLEEFQPGYYETLKERGDFDLLEPIAHHNPNPDAGESDAGETREPVYEPAYPIGQRERLYEVHEKEQDFGLRFLMVQSMTTRSARLSRTIRTFKKEINQAELLSRTANVYDLAPDSFSEFGELGHVSPLLLSGTREYNEIMLGIRSTASAFQKVTSKIAGRVESGTIEIPNSVDRYAKQEGSPGVGPQATGLKPLGDDPLALNIVREAGYVSTGGMVNFGVPGTEFTQTYVPFGDKVQKIQEGILRRYAQIIHKLNEEAQIDQTGEAFTTPLDDELAGRWASFLNRELAELIERRTDHELGSGDRKKFVRKHLTPEIQKAFSQYILRLDFISKVGEQFRSFESARGKVPDVQIEGVPVLKEIQRLVDAATGLSKAIQESIKGSRQSVEEYYRGQGGELQGNLDLSNASIESVSARFPNRFADMEADGYPNPTTQHIGGGNAEVTLEITTNNQLLLDQLGALKRSQQALAELRKQKDVVPPLIQVMGEGSFLRSLGIKQLAYRSHTVTTDPDKPGVYQIRLDLIQDEETLVRAEEFRRVGGLRRSQIFNTEATLPLALPMESAPETPTAGDQLLGTQLTGYDPKAPIGTWDMLVGLSPVELEDQPFPAPPRTIDRSGESFPEAGDTTEWSSPSLYGADVPYQNMEGPNGAAGLEDFKQEWTPMSAQVSYIPPPDREGPFSAIEMSVNWDHNGASEQVDVAPTLATRLLAPIVSYLDYAQQQLGEDIFRRLVSQVNSALSTTGYRKGLVLSWLTLAFGSNVAEKRDVELEFTNATGLGPSVSSGGGISRELSITDNLTLKSASILSGLIDDTRTGTFGSALRIAADELGRAIVRPDPTRRAYKDWLEARGRTIPGEAEHPEATKANRPYDFSSTKQSVQKLSSWFAKMEKQTPSAYPDLLFPPIRDPESQTHIIAPDFPFGPGTNKLGKDQYLDDYQFADSMRQVAAVKKASIGLEALQSYVSPGQEGSREDPIPESGAENPDPTITPKDFSRPSSESSEEGRIIGRNIERVRQATEEAVADIRDRVNSGGGGNDFPFQVGEEGEGMYFDKMMSWAEENGAFSSQLDRTLQVKDLARIKRVSATMEYVTKLIEAANIAAGETAHLTEDRDNATRSGQPMPEKQRKIVSKAVDALQAGDLNYFFRGESVRDAMQSYQNVEEVQQDFWLKKERNELIDLWRADDKKIAKKHGYYDLTTEPRRQELMSKLSETWRDYLGMRRAFPTYMLLKAGPTGTGRFQVMSDIYSWTAVQSITRRNLAENAGEQAEVVISNMRKQVEGGRRSVELFNQKSYDSPKQKIENGDHMYVYMGYGPDEEHLDGFPGRVTSYQPGPITRIQLDSYSTTLNNMPSGGSGFAINGRDGQQTIAEAVLYTISQTEGLEGLGRSSMFSAQDSLGREFRGDAEDDFRTSMALSLWRTLGSPLEDTVLGQSNEGAKNLIGMISESGLGNAKDILLGDPQIYENIWVTASGEKAGYVDTFAGKFDELLTEGKGWGWTALPGETTWAQLNKMSDLWQNYIVTARPYNQNASPAELAKHPLRQTLYFGPKEGVYIHSSKSTGEHDSFSNLSEEELRDLVRKVRSGPGGRPGTSERREDRILETLYEDLFINGFLLRELHRALGGSGSGNVFQEFADGVSEWATSVGSGTFLTSIFEAAFDQGAIQTDRLPSNQAEALWGRIQKVFPNLIREFNDAIRPEDVREISLFAVFRGEGKPSPPTAWVKAFSAPYHEVSNDRPTSSNLTEEEEERQVFERVAEGLLSGFVEDLQNLAIPDATQQNLASPETQHPVIQEIRRRLLQKGFVPGKRTKPVQKHHFTNTYEHILRNGIRASDRDRDFANKITLTWPSDPDNRLSAYFGSGGDKMRYSVKANPMIAEDFIVEKEVPFMNMRYDLQEETGLIASQLEKAPGGENFGALIARRTRLIERIRDGENLQEEKKEVEEAIHKVIKELGSSVVRPKYSVVATNNLNQSMSYMYQGEVAMLGNPDIKPHHVMHIWDDVEQMHGPVEARGVLQKFGSGGYRTVALPRLHSNVRGADSTMDTTWMGYAQQLQSTYSYFERAASGIGDFIKFAGRSAMYGFGLNYLGSTGASFLSNIGLSATGRAASVLGGPLGIALVVGADAVWTLTDFLEETGARKERLFLGMMTGALDANPLSFVPLTYRGKPYTAGLAGATGPGSITDVMVRDLNNLRREPGNVGRDIFDTIRDYGGFMGPEQG